MSDSKRLLILAGAGSGKTHTVISKIIRLVNEKQVRPDGILAITFSNKAANEMKSRLEAAVGSAADMMFVSTFHKLGSFLLRKYGDVLGLGEFTICSGDDGVNLLGSCYPEMAKKDLREIVASIMEAKDRGYGPADYCEWKGAREGWEKHFAKYEDALRKSGCVDFADLINLPCAILSSRHDIREEVRGRWGYVFVDEYQDTNRKQSELLSHLVGENTRLCAVGDDDQSIYAFRGAENDHILNFRTVFPDAEVIKLEQNYRSTKSIIALSNSLIRENVKRNDKVLWTDNEIGEMPKLLVFPDSRDEERIVARMACELKGSGSVCVMYRNNSQSLGFESALAKMGAAYCVFKGNSFFQKEEIQDCVAYMSFALNPRDLAKFARLIHKPARGIGKKALDAIGAKVLVTGDDVVSAALDCAELKSRQKEEIKKLGALITEALDALDRADPDTFLTRLFVDTGLFAMHGEESDVVCDSVMKRNETTAETPRQDNIRQFMRMMKENGAAGGRESLRSFLENASLSSQTDVPDMQAIVLSSMHSVKGLEFDYCFVTGLEDEIIPSSRQDDEEEERRLLYVAMTRAKRRLYLTCSGERFRNGFCSSASPSRFIDDFDPSKYERKDLTGMFERFSSFGGRGRRPARLSGASSGWRKGADFDFSGERFKSAGDQDSRLAPIRSSGAQAKPRAESLILKKDQQAESAKYAIGDEVVNAKNNRVGRITRIRRLGAHVVIDVVFPDGQKSSFSEGSAHISKKP